MPFPIKVRPNSICRLFILTLLSTGLFPAQEIMAVRQPAEVVSVRPATFRSLKPDIWNNINPGDRVTEGSFIKTDPYGRLSLLLPNQMLLKVGGNTLFAYGEEADTGASLLRLRKGKLWMRSEKMPRGFRVHTPTATTAIRGTEWFMEVAEDGTTSVGVLDGSVVVENPLGKVILEPRELALVLPGKPPQKMVYLTPTDAVNWTLRYRGIWSESDLARSTGTLSSGIRAAIEAYHRNNYKKAFEIVRSLEKSQGNKAEWAAIVGFLKMVSGDHRGAREAFGRARSLAPDWALPVSHLALMDLVENQTAQALKRAREAVKIEPKSPTAHVVLAYALKGRLKMEEAYRASQEALHLGPGFTEGILVAARLALELERYKETRTLLESIKKESSAEAISETLLGYLSLREGKNFEALSHFERAITLDREWAEPMLGSGISLFRLGREKEGQNSVIKATLMEPQVSLYQAYLAKSYFEVKRFSEAKQSIERAKRLDPKDPTPYLYEAIFLFDQHEPIRALAAIEKAFRLNGNRAVFRSRYLLDQDQAVLMANIAQIYSRVGFHRKSVQQAYDALLFDPTNEGAHRRLYFALLFDPSYYDQGAASEKLLTKLLVPTTRSAVIFDEDQLSPYTHMFDRSGADKTIVSNRFQQRDNDTRAIVQSGTADFAGKTKGPFAYHVQGFLDQDKFQSSLAPGPLKSATDTETLVGSSFFKWRPRPGLDLFLEANRNKSDTFSDSLYFFNLRPFTLSDNEQNSDVTNLDAGLHGAFGAGNHLFTHFSYYRLSADMNTDTTIYQPNMKTVLDGETDDEQIIFHTAYWKKWQDHFFQVGGRHFEGDLVNSSLFSSGLFRNSFKEKHKSEFDSIYLYHQWTANPAVVLIGGVAADYHRFKDEKGRGLSGWDRNPSFGFQWKLTSLWSLRAAYIRTTQGDRSERLQPSLIARFPLLRVNQVDLFTPEQLLNLERDTIAFGLDRTSLSEKHFWGIELAHDVANAYQRDPARIGGRLKTDNNTLSLFLFLESCWTDRFSSNITYRFARTDLPGEYDENRIGTQLYYFLPAGLRLNLNIEYIDINPEKNEPLVAEAGSWKFQPRLSYQFFRNRITISLNGLYEARDMSHDHKETKRFQLLFSWKF